jgi:hypothetical protein
MPEAPPHHDLRSGVRAIDLHIIHGRDHNRQAATSVRTSRWAPATFIAYGDRDLCIVPGRVELERGRRGRIGVLDGVGARLTHRDRHLGHIGLVRAPADQPAAQNPPDVG